MLTRLLCFIVVASAQDFTLCDLVIEARQLRITEVAEHFVAHINDCRPLIVEAASNGHEHFSAELYKWSGERFDDLQRALSEAARLQFGERFYVRVERYSEEFLATTLMWPSADYASYYLASTSS